MTDQKERRPAANGTAQQQAYQAETTVTDMYSGGNSSDHPSHLAPGDALAVTDAMRYRRGVAWTDAEVAYVVQLAYETGRMHAAGEDLAETIACWREFAEPRATREERIAGRLATMGPSRPPRFDDPTWPAVAVPGMPGLRLGPDEVVRDGQVAA